MIRPLVAGLPPDVGSCLELVVSELATNAVRHARTAYEVAVRLVPVMRVEVTDGSATPPVLAQPDLRALGGRGLIMVDHCAHEWGTTIVHGGKIVWAEL